MGTNTLRCCVTCKQDKPLASFSKNKRSPDGLQQRCKDCFKVSNDKFNPTTNKERMTVNGKYISRRHPLWKAGNYRTFEDAAFSSLQNYKTNPTGYVYIIGNPAWNGWVKVGKAVDANDRLNSYQTSSPLRDYVLYYSYKCFNRNTAEKKAHKALAKKFDKRNEWFYCTPEDAKEILERIL